MSNAKHLQLGLGSIRKTCQNVSMTSVGFAPATQTFATDLSQRIQEVRLFSNPVCVLLDNFFAGAITAYNEWIAPLCFAVNANVVVVLFEVYHCCTRLGPREEIVCHPIYLYWNLWGFVATRPHRFQHRTVGEVPCLLLYDATVTTLQVQILQLTYGLPNCLSFLTS